MKSSGPGAPDEGSRPLNDLDFDELAARVAALGGSQAQARRIFAALYRPGRDPGELALGRLDEVSPRIVERIAAAPWGRLRVIDRRRAADGFVKYLFESPLGGRFEAVRIPLFDEKHVVCVSSQVGCALGCAFCATGRLGFTRNLETWEMVEELRVVRDEARLPVRHAVFMGMGEPFLNYERVLRAARLFTRSGGLQIAGRNVTISTAGIVPAIRRFTAEGHPFRLTFSLTSAIPEKRRQLMPVEGAHPLPELVEAIRAFTAARRERAVVAYVAIRGLNTGREDVEALRRTFEGIPIKLEEDELRRFRDMLQVLRVPIGRRYSGGKEIGASCGSLAATQQGGERLAGDGAPLPGGDPG